MPNRIRILSPSVILSGAKRSRRIPPCYLYPSTTGSLDCARDDCGLPACDAESIPFGCALRGRHRNSNGIKTSQRFTIRLADLADVEAIAEHRARMFDEMGQVPPDMFETLRMKSSERLRDFLKRGDYIGWLAVPAQQPDIIAGGAGVQLRDVLPHPLSCSNQWNGVADGRHAIILNVFTEPPWRHQGIALLLLQRIIEWARAERLDRLVLHASEAGRPLYERLGFVDTHEMRLASE